MKEKEKLALQILKLLLGTDKKAMMRVGLQLIERSSGERKRFSSK